MGILIYTASFGTMDVLVHHLNKNLSVKNTGVQICRQLVAGHADQSCGNDSRTTGGQGRKGRNQWRDVSGASSNPTLCSGFVHKAEDMIRSYMWRDFKGLLVELRGVEPLTS